MVELDLIKELCAAQKIRPTHHALKRAVERGIDLKTDIVPAIMNGEILEEYPNDYPYKSYLLIGITAKNKPLHVLCSVGDGELWIITEYFPNNMEWENDFKTRKKVL